MTAENADVSRGYSGDQSRGSGMTSPGRSNSDPEAMGFRKWVYERMKLLEAISPRQTHPHRARWYGTHDKLDLSELI
jgi:hypothetical protein